MTTLLHSPIGKMGFYNIDEIYLGIDDGTPRVVVKVNDLVVNYRVGLYRVVAMNGQVPVLELWDPSKNTHAGSGDDLIGAITAYQPSVLSSAYYDNSTNPRSIALDMKTYFTGSGLTHLKLFRGTDTGPGGIVISRNFVGNSENIELESLSTRDIGLKRAKSIYTYADLVDGDVVTAVAYSPRGPEGSVSFVVRHSSAFRPLDANTRYIIDVSLVSDYLDSVDTDTLVVPEDQVLSSANFQARLHYSDGFVTAPMEIDGTKFRIVGLDGFNTSWLGDGAHISLAYYADPTEAIINSTSVGPNMVSKTYTITTRVLDPQYSFRLYVAPRWNMGTGNYTLNYWLTNAQHEYLVNLSAGGVAVTANRTDGDPVNTGLFDVWQDVNLSIDIADVFPALGSRIFTQRIGMYFSAPASGDISNRPWMINYGNNLNVVYGNANGVRAETTNVTWEGKPRPVRVDCGVGTVEDWISRMYSALLPGYDNELYDVAPVPTHFRISWYENGTWNTTPGYIPVDDYDQWHATAHGASPGWSNYDLLVISWHRFDSGTSTYSDIAVTPVVSYVSTTIV